jgi:CRP/FNR family transcriptional regulator, cyclic AMP receptor protein
MTDDPIAALKAVPLFHDFSDRALNRVLEISKEVSHPPGKVVVEEDASAVGFHLILDGSAEISVDGKVVGTFGPGEYFGEMSLIDGKPRSASVTATTELRTLSIPAWNFESLMMEHPEIMRAMLKVLCERVRRLEASPRG